VLACPDIAPSNDALSTGTALLLRTLSQESHANSSSRRRPVRRHELGHWRGAPAARRARPSLLRMSSPIPIATRAALLERAAVDAARSWAGLYCAALADEGRRVEGGWPGTIREARTRVAAEAMRVLTKQSMTRLTHDELDRLAQATYDEARRAWLRSSRGRTRQ
jgi:hypothetical protein